MNHFNQIFEASQERARKVVIIAREMRALGHYDPDKNLWDQAVKEFNRRVLEGDEFDPMLGVSNSEDFIRTEANYND